MAREQVTSWHAGTEARVPLPEQAESLAVELVELLLANEAQKFDPALDAVSQGQWGTVLSIYLGVAFVEPRVHEEFAGWVIRHDSPMTGYCWAVLLTIEDMRIARLAGSTPDDVRQALRGLAFAIASEDCGQERLRRDIETRREGRRSTAPRRSA